jgi:hypothetical protein
MGQSSPWGGDRTSGVLDAKQDGACIVSQQYDVEDANPVILDQFRRDQGLKCYHYLRSWKEVSPGGVTKPLLSAPSSCL